MAFTLPPHCDLANILLLRTISVNESRELWPHLKALDFGLTVKAVCRDCGVLESPRFNRTWEGWGFFLLYVPLSRIHFNTCSMLFIKDKTPSQILASCKTFHGRVFSWLPVSAVWVTHACCYGSFCVRKYYMMRFLKLSRIITGNRASFEPVLLCLCSVLFLRERSFISLVLYTNWFSATVWMIGNSSQDFNINRTCNVFFLLN